MLLFGYSGGQSPPADMLVQGMSQESCLANRPKRGRDPGFTVISIVGYSTCVVAH